MKKSDILIVGALFAALLLWPVIFRQAEKLLGIEHPPPESVEITEPDAGDDSQDAAVPAEEEVVEEEDVIVSAPSEEPADVEPDKARSRVKTVSGKTEDESDSVVELGKLFDLTSEKVVLHVTPAGAGVASVELLEYQETVQPESNPVMFDFGDRLALAYSGLEGFSSSDSFQVEVVSDDRLIATMNRADGLQLKRTMTLLNDYRLVVRDVFHNTGQEQVILPDHALWVGKMRMLPSETRARGFDYLGVDAQPVSDSTRYWARSLPKLFKKKMKEEDGRVWPLVVSDRDAESLGRSKLIRPFLPVKTAVDWVAAKNKFFVQILVPDNEVEGYGFRAYRKTTEDLAVGSDVKDNDLDEVAAVTAALRFMEIDIGPGKSLSRELTYYVGPKKYSILRELGRGEAAVMDFGFWTPFCKILLTILNAIHRFVPNYGVAIILLTVILRVVFWPITRKSTESMKKMQAIQPLIAELKTKYKNDAKKLNEETMKLYKEHKVNPMGGCLPMVIQIPVFIALFVVLRSAIELRFAPFLWIDDLSEPERLFYSVLHFPLNVLPILMAVTMIWQQKLMPTSDASQQKMMMFFMPIMMLVICYSFASALALYWTANQCVAIGMQLVQQWKTRHSEPAPA